MSRINPRVVRGAAVLGILFLGVTGLQAAHEIPADVTVHAIVKPDDTRLHLLVRVPLEAMRDMDFPLRGPGYLELDSVQPMLEDAARLWLADYVELFENGQSLGPERLIAARVSIPSDRSFSGYAAAVAHVMGPPLRDVDLYWSQALLDVLFEVPIEAPDSRFSIDPRFAHLGLRTLSVLRFIPPDGAERLLQYRGDPGMVRLDPRWYQAAWRFVALGFEHILDGLDHLLFLLCLVIPVRRLRPLIPIVTAFTVAHSITLIASALGLTPRGLWFPPFIETLIALSIVYMALENIIGVKPGRRWIMAFGFGLVHGFGFSFALAETLQFAGRHLLTSLLSFNVGVELGQLLVLAVVIPLLWALFRFVVAERMGVIILSALVAHTAWHWMTARGSELLQYDGPRLGGPGAAEAGLRWLTLLALVCAVSWGLDRAYRRWTDRSFPPTEEVAP